MVNSSRRPRPPGATGGVTVTTKSLWAWTLLALYATTGQAASFEHFPSSQRSRSTTSRETHVVSRRSQPSRSPAENPLPHIDIPTANLRNTEDQNADVVQYRDALAPARKPRAVDAPLAQSSEDTGPHALSARLLQDWEATDIILMSTIDGVLHARDRKTGQHRWSLDTREPMIETVQAIQPQEAGLEEQTASDYRFAVEPSPDGQLYALFSDPLIGLVRSSKTVKKMAVDTPFSMELSGYRFMVTSKQTSSYYLVDVQSGEILNQVGGQHGWKGSDFEPRCRRRNDLEVEDPACHSGRLLRLGRNTYEFTVSDELTGSAVYTVKFSEWVPYVNNKVLQDQYAKSFDGLDIQTSFTGRFVGMDTNAGEGRMPQYTHVLNATVARIFDVLRPVDNDADTSAGLIVLARPSHLPIPSQHQSWANKREELRRSDLVYLNQTADGTWYAMSEQSYPGFSVGAPRAPMSYLKSGKRIDLNGNTADVVGIHVLSSFNRNTPVDVLSIGGSKEDTAITPNLLEELEEYETSLPLVNPAVSQPAVSTSVLIPYTLLLCILVFYAITQREVLKRLLRQYLKVGMEKPESIVTQGLTKSEAINPTEATSLPGQLSIQDDDQHGNSDVKPVTSESSADTPPVDANCEVSVVSGGASPKKKPKPSDQEDDDSEGDSEDDDAHENLAVQPNDAKPKKKYKRGKRGGRKNKKKTMDPSTFDEKPLLAIEQPLDAGMIQVGTLKIDMREDTCLGRGSNGTTVYPGLFNGREVAVKRLIKSTNDLAKKEIKHLMSSDENAHVVRFFTHEESRDFFYIALDKFTTSLDQFVEHSELFPSLISETRGFDIKNCLQQITYGVQHLHSLKLVHRDIKPQNILLKPVRSNRPTPEMPPLLFVISDFGLCKPLEEGAMSTFAPTFNHTAAGTTGWRAPELLVGPRDAVAAPSVDSTQSSSTDYSRDGTVIDPPSGRRATKAIDIFSLGCVFYYVMTRGGHPFDKGGSSLGRDLNIKENNFTTELLQLHKYEYDADDLILQMVKHEPKERPDCARILRHPYFLTQEQKLDFLCLVSDCYEGEKNSINNIHDGNAVRTQAELAALGELAELEGLAANVIGIKSDGTTRDFLTALPKSFITEMGKQRRYTGTRMIDLLRVIRNKKNHFKDLPADVKAVMLKNSDGHLAGYYQFWAERFPSLLINCHALIVERNLVSKFGMEKWYE